MTILALGGLLMPVLLAARYSERDALGLLTGAGSLGLLFPPCLPVILYSIVASSAMVNLGAANASPNSVTMEKMFLGGLGPGVLMVALTAWWGIRRQPKEGVVTQSFDAAEARRAIREAKWELLLPVVVIYVLLGGFATPVETSAFTVLYALVVEILIHRDYKSFEKLSSVFVEAGLLAARRRIVARTGPWPLHGYPPIVPTSPKPAIPESRYQRLPLTATCSRSPTANGRRSSGRSAD